MNLQVQPGEQYIADGVGVAARGGRGAEVLVSEFMGRFYEMTYRKKVFSTQVSGYTYAATGNTPLAAGTGVPVVGVYNPTGSPVNLVLLLLTIATTSGTPGGPFHWNVIPAPAGITAAGAAPVSHFTFQASGSQAKGFANAVITGSAAATYLRPVGGPAAIAAGAGVNSITEFVDGSIIVPPGAFAGVAGTAVGTTHVLSAGLVWAEVLI